MPISRNAVVVEFTKDDFPQDSIASIFFKNAALLHVQTKYILNDEGELLSGSDFIRIKEDGRIEDQDISPDNQLLKIISLQMRETRSPLHSIATLERFTQAWAEACSTGLEASAFESIINSVLRELTREVKVAISNNRGAVIKYNSTWEQPLYPSNEQQKQTSKPILKQFKKWIVDTFKCYKHNEQRLLDYWQPIRGILQVLRGVISFPTIIILGLLSILTFENKFKDSIIFEIFNPWLILTGFLNILSSPLLFFRIPLRLFLTHKYGEPSIIQNKDIRREIQIYTDAITILHDDSQCPNAKEEAKKKSSESRENIIRKVISYYYKCQKDAELFCVDDSLKCPQDGIVPVHDAIERLQDVLAGKPLADLAEIGTDKTPATAYKYYSSLRCL